MKQRIAQLITFVLLIPCFLFGSGSYEILSFSQDARSLSLHNAASAYDGPFLRNNPAALSIDSEGMIYSYLLFPAGIHSIEIQKLMVENNRIHVNKISFISYGAIIDSKTDEKTSAFDILLEMGYKRPLENIASIGLSGGYLFSSIAGYYSQILYTNIGIRSRMMRKRVGVGFSLENAGFILTSYTDVKEPIPVIFRSSCYYKPRYLSAIISVDIINNLDRNSTELSGGLEFNPGKRLTIRLGCSNQRRGFITGDFSSDLLAAVSGGAGFQFKKIYLDVGFMNLGAAGYVVGFSIFRKSD